MAFDAVLIAVGRVPNIENVGLEEAGVNYDDKGILVNKNCLTSNSNVFSVGDCVEGPQFTHSSDA